LFTAPPPADADAAQLLLRSPGCSSEDLLIYFEKEPNA
jgi:hypothetical protein